MTSARPSDVPKPASWQFAESISAGRQAALARFTSFQPVVDALKECKVVDFAWETPRDAALAGCQRASFRLRVSPPVYDAFFNSPHGYRGQYAISPKVGYEGNFKVLDALEPALVKYVQVVGGSVDRVVWSLRAPDAKIWIDESEVQEQLGCSEPQILYEPWQLKSEDGAGLLAPLGERLEVMGAWVDPTGTFRPNPKKAGRADEIFLVGFA